MGKISLEKADNMMFIDKTGATTDMTLPYGRSEKGKRVSGTRPVSHGKRISTIGSLSSIGLEACMTFEGTLNGEVFLSFICNFLCPILKEGQVVITDNAKTHKVRGVKEMIESKVAKLIYLPPYSPELSPMELCWSKVKQFLKKAKARSEEALIIAISDAIDMITEYDCKGWLGYCGYVA